MNHNITNLRDQIDFLEKSLDIRNSNLNEVATNQIKETVNFGFYYISQKLNASNTDLYNEKLRNEMRQSIWIITEGRINGNSLQSMDTSQLKIILDREYNTLFETINSDVAKKNGLNTFRKHLEFYRDFVSIFLLLFQIGTTFFWISGTMLKERKN